MELIKRKKSTLQYIARITELRRALGITSARYNTLIMDVTNVMPIYESDNGKLVLMHRG